METKVVIIDEKNIDESLIKEAAEYIKMGEVVAFPTETVYGLGADALNAEAVKKIFQAKGRPQDNPLIIHVADFDIKKYVKEVPEKAKKLMEKFWPGPLTIVFNKQDIIPDETSAQLKTIGVRMPSSEVALKLIREVGTPIAAPSANLSGKPSPTRVEHCIEDLSGKVPFILGGEYSEVGVESTIVDITGDKLCVLRPGGITLSMLKEVDEEVYIDPAVMEKPREDFKPKAPGMKYRHYAPKAPVKIICGELQKTVAKINEMVQNYKDDGKRVAIIATDETKAMYKEGVIVSVGTRTDIQTVGKNLFKVLREFDDMDVDLIISEAFDEYDLGVAIMNRLKKSAGFNIIYV
ncbi:translation factor SUA5 [Clostridium collagenovorans DSM 3089]|uniref:Threonylcarbamoyl-AMP synthase n=1 Tax=Clostridium collagenovorans DSM 3089 TaxID=1121306 RepID=A0A1M5W2Y7_9CLOT|nr:L-threonylcarbamoyladenylate synthase [Clostridium collagenovorans]SHH81855.1 translation factor SUA5 [Clostridium collagenovorans DSM 3089]